ELSPAVVALVWYTLRRRCQLEQDFDELEDDRTGEVGMHGLAAVARKEVIACPPVLRPPL
ncbi:unnamed protein product, partial [Effrenium voratum]